MIEESQIPKFLYSLTSFTNRILFFALVFLLSIPNCSHEFEYGYYKDDGACFSPDGNYIAFAHTQVYYQPSGDVDTLVCGIYIMKLDG
jgi:hypothetical protein